jgi:thiamine biosynthesis lipoprotein
VNLSCLVEGYALRELDDLLSRLGSEHHLITVSGEVLARGCGVGGAEWRVGVQLPAPQAEQGVLATSVQLKDRCMATSGTARQFFEANGHRYSHLIDPRSCRPVEHGLRSVTVIHEDGLLADAWATALMILGPQEGKEMAKKHGLNAVFITDAYENTLRTTSHFTQPNRHVSRANPREG